MTAFNTLNVATCYLSNWRWMHARTNWNVSESWNGGHKMIVTRSNGSRVRKLSIGVVPLVDMVLRIKGIGKQKPVNIVMQKYVAKDSVIPSHLSHFAA
jgi:hypothetical protein